MQFISNNLDMISFLVLLTLIWVQDRRVTKLQKRVQELEDKHSKEPQETIKQDKV